MNLLSFIQYTETLARRLVINTPQHHSTHKPSLIFPHFQLISLPSPSFSSSLLFLKNPRFHFFLPLRGLFEPEERESQRLFLTQFFFLIFYFSSSNLLVSFFVLLILIFFSILSSRFVLRDWHVRTSDVATGTRVGLIVTGLTGCGSAVEQTSECMERRKP